MRRVGALIFPGFELLDLFGPLEMLGMLDEHYDLTLVAEKAGQVVSSGQVSAYADISIHDGDEFDILFIPGGRGTRRLVEDRAALDWIAESSRKAELTLSVCTGSLLLGKAGLLDGRRATTNKMAFNWVADQVPNAHWVAQARWVENGNLFTSSGVSAGMDMTLAVIAKLQGVETAEKVAMVCEYDWHRDASWDPFAAHHGLV